MPLLDHRDHQRDQRQQRQAEGAGDQRWSPAGPWPCGRPRRSRETAHRCATVKISAPTSRHADEPGEPVAKNRVAESSSATVSDDPGGPGRQPTGGQLDRLQGGGGGGHQLAPENSLRRLTMPRAMHVDREGDHEQDETGGDERLTSSPYASGKLSAMFGGDRAGFVRGEQAEGDDRRRREDHRDGHRLAEGATESEHRRGHDARRGRTAGPPSGSSPSGSRRGPARPPRAARGVWRKISRLSAVMIGRIMTASTTADREDRASGGRDVRRRTAGTSRSAR